MLCHIFHSGVQRLVEEGFSDEVLALKMRGLNDRLMLAERGFLDTDGIKGREWFKHLVCVIFFENCY